MRPAMRRVGTGLILICAAAIAADAGSGFLAGFTLDEEHMQQWALPSRLREISGLALTRDDRLLVVDDEKAIIYEVDYLGGGLVKAFAFDKPVLKGDFEGIAVLDGTVWLVTSEGRLYAGTEGEDGERIEFERFKTKLDDECEFEGLAADARRGRLLMLCKNVLGKADQIDDLSIFVWDVEDEDVAKKATIELPVRDIAEKLGTRRLHPSGIAMTPDGTGLLIVAAREGVLIEIGTDGELRDAILLTPRNKHPQAEGIEIDSEGRLIISDEGRDGRARLSVYRKTG